MSGRDIIVVGASAGGVEALIKLVSGLPADLPATVFITLHVPSWGTSTLPQILSRGGALPASHPGDGERIERGRIYVAPPDHHLLVKPGHVRLIRGPRENHARPAVDVMFRTAALAYGSRVVGVILTGTLDDGTAGLILVKHHGGVAVVQDPADALYSGMPASAVENAEPQHVLPLAGIATCLLDLVGDGGGPGMPDRRPDIIDITEIAMNSTVNNESISSPSGYTCPECGGALWEERQDDFTSFRCRVGHKYSETAFMAGHGQTVEAALWTALRVLEENASAARRMASRMADRGQKDIAARYLGQADDSDKRARVIRAVVVREPPDQAVAM